MARRPRCGTQDHRVAARGNLRGDPAVVGSPPRSHGCLFLQVRGLSVCVAQAFIPPSTVRFAPVMYEDSGPATNATNAATSSTRPKRSSAVAAFCGTRPLARGGIQLRVDRTRPEVVYRNARARAFSCECLMSY